MYCSAPNPSTFELKTTKKTNSKVPNSYFKHWGTIVGQCRVGFFPPAPISNLRKGKFIEQTGAKSSIHKEITYVCRKKKSVNNNLHASQDMKVSVFLHFFLKLIPKSLQKGETDIQMLWNNFQRVLILRAKLKVYCLQQCILVWYYPLIRKKLFPSNVSLRIWKQTDLYVTVL